MTTRERRLIQRFRDLSDIDRDRAFLSLAAMVRTLPALPPGPGGSDAVNRVMAKLETLDDDPANDRLICFFIALMDYWADLVH
jgi:hypothetical protein